MIMMKLKRRYLVVLMSAFIVATFGNQECSPYEYPKEDNPPITDGLSYICELDRLTPNLNFSMLPANRTLELNIKCQKEVENGTLLPKTFSHLSHLINLRIEECSMMILKQDILFGLDNLQLLLVSERTKDIANMRSNLILEPNFFNHVPKMKTLDFSSLALTTVPKSILCPLLKVENLILDHNNFVAIENIGCGESGSCCRNVSTLELSNNRILQITAKEFWPMQEMKQLHLAFNSIKVIEERALEKMTSLDFITLKSNRLKSLPNSLFRFNRRLKQIDLQENLIRQLPPDLFYGLHELLALNLNKNKLITLTQSIFKDFSSLQTLDISNNLIAEIPPNMFHHMGSVKMLWMADNAIHSIEDTGIDQLHQMQDLDISCNHLEQISADYFTNLTGLIMLDLSENLIQELPSFFKQKNLTLLNLSDNRITEFKNGLNLSNQIQELRLANNTLANVSFSTLSIKAVQILLLNSTKLNSLSGLNVTCPHLTELYADHNNISHLGQVILHMSKLLRFNISYNVLKGEFDFSLRIPNSLRVLDVSRNFLTSFSNTFGKPHEFKLRVLHAAYNQIRYVKSSIFPLSLRTVDLSNNNIVTVEPYAFTPLTSLSALKLSYNNITRTNLTWFDFKKTFTLPHVDLTHNNLECDCSNTWLLNPEYNFITKTSHCAVTHQRIKRFRSKQKFSNETANQLLCQLDDADEKCVPSCTCYYTVTKSIYEVDCGGYNDTFNITEFPILSTRVFLDGVDSISFVALSRPAHYKYLTSLFLNSSHISNLPNDAFQSLPNLRELHLENNRLKELPLSAVRNLNKLEFLYLQKNQLMTIDNLIFTFLSSLRLVTLHSNKLGNLTGINVSRTIREITISDNPFKCSCRYISELQEWVFEKDIIIPDANSTYCTNQNDVKVNLLAFNTSSCYGPPEKPPLDITLMGMMIFTGISLSVFICLTGIYMFREELLVYLYARFGIRIFHSNKEDRSEKMYDAFICYSYQDEDFVANELVPGLKQYRLCLHERDFPVGGFIVESVIEAVQQSCRTILVLSPNFVRSEWCRFEFMTAHQQSLKDRCCRLLMIILNDVPLEDMEPELRLYLHTNTYLRWGNKQFWDKLRFALPHLEPEMSREKKESLKHHQFS